MPTLDYMVSFWNVEASANTTQQVTAGIDSDEGYVVISISICNTHATLDTTFKLWIDGTTPNVNAYLYHTQPLPAKSTFHHNSKIVLRPGDQMQFETTEAVTCHINVNAMKQSSIVTTGAGTNYFDRTLIYQTGTSAAVAMTPVDTANLITVLSYTICSHEPSNSTTFDIYGAIGSSNEQYRLYDDQPLPPLSTFEHSDKLVLENNNELYFDQADSRNVSVICSFLRQIPS